MLAPVAFAADGESASAQTQPAPDEQQKDLAQKLIRGSTPQDRDVMGTIVGLMERVQDKLKKGFDPGPETQAVQKDIIKQLDAAIASARRQRSSSGGDPSGDKRRSEPSRSPPESKSVQPDATAGAPGKNGSTASNAPASGKTAGDLRETRRSWGHLPNRDREEMIQSEFDAVLSGFQSLADHYFRALAETEEDERP
jgi:hypothetical protein